MKKVKIFCKEANRAVYEKMLLDGGFELAEDADVSLVENGYVPEYLIAKDNDQNVLLYIKDIIIIETSGKDIVARSSNGTFKIKYTLEHLEQTLKPAGFFRISQSAIIQKSALERISTGFSMRFHLTLKCGIKTDVTRSYYYTFKDIIGL